MTDIVLLDGARTAIGTFGGALAGIAPIDLATVASKAALERSGVDGAQIGNVVFGHVINTEPRDMYLSRVAAMQAGIPDTTPAMNVNRLCGSGAQAIVSAVQSLMLGDADFALAGGAESMSRSPYIVPQARWGAKMGDVTSLDMMLGALNCPFGTGHMGVTAENVAAEHWHQPRRPGRLRPDQPAARRRRHRGRLFRCPDRPGRGEGPPRHGGVQARRAPEGNHCRGPGGSAHRVQEGRHGDRRQCQRHQ